MKSLILFHEEVAEVISEMDSDEAVQVLEDMDEESGSKSLAKFLKRRGGY